MKKTLFFLFVLGSIVSLAQDANALKYSKTITVKDCKKHLNYLASDELEGREAGTEGQKRAAVYLMQQFNQFGIPQVNGKYFQKFPLRVIKPEKINLLVNGKSLTYLKDFLHNSDFKENNFENAELVFVGYGVENESYNDYSGVNVKDKVVMFWDGTPSNKKGESYLQEGKKARSNWEDRFFKVKHAQSKGAKAVIIINNRVEEFVKSHRHYFGKEKMQLLEEKLPMPIPVLSIANKLTDSILAIGGYDKSSEKVKKRITKKGKPLSKELNVKIGIRSSVINEKVSSENVLAYVEGSDLKDEVIVVTAHYDHIGIHDGKVFNGADDDGSGTTALLEMAQAFAKAKSEGHGPRRSILFMPVSAEEKGLLGSKYYSNHPIFPLKNTIANLNIDMIGRIDDQHENGNYVYIIGSDFLSNDLHSINEQANETYTKLELDYTFNNKTDPNRYYYRSDHYNFAKHNVPVIFYFNGVHEDYHKHTDTVEKIDFEKLAKISKLVFFTAWDLANREERIKLNDSDE